MIKTEICQLLNIKYPILQGGMAWVSTSELVSAVSEAGGFGIIASGMLDPSGLAEEISKAKELTNKPFGVNLMMLHPDVDGLVQVILDNPVTAVTTGAGNPSKYIPALKAAGMKVIPVVASVALAKRMERCGADAVVAEGTESGGHIGETTTICLVPEVVDAVSIPVIAAGGIADGRGLAAALMLGAKGVQMGTRFLCAKETPIHDEVKKRVLAAGDRETVITGRCTGHPVRVLKNRLTKELSRLDEENRPEELIKMGTGKLKAAMRQGDVKWGSLMCGQIAGLIREIQPVSEIINQIIEEATSVLQRGYNLTQ